MRRHSRRVVFFDLDGTLHQQDMFGSFLRFMLRHNLLNIVLVIVLLPLIGAILLIKGRAARLPMSMLLWAMTFGRSKVHLKAVEDKFVAWFRQHVTAFPAVHERLTHYLTSVDADVWLITGSPKQLVEQVYADTAWLPKVNLIASTIAPGSGGLTLTLRCLGYEKVAQLEQHIGSPLRLYSGYSDSNQDNPLLGFCEHRWRVTPAGQLQQLE